MKRFLYWRCAILAVLSGTSLATSARAEVLYRETFGRTTTGNTALTPWDWAVFNGAGANGGNKVNGGDDGRPIDVANTPSAGPHQDGSFTPYPDGWTFMDGSLRLTMTTEFSFNPADYMNNLKFSWYQGNTSLELGQFQVAVRQGGSWYVSAQQFVNTVAVTGGANFGTMPAGAGGAELMEYTYAPTAANWRTLTFDGNYTLGGTPGTGTFVASTVPLAMGAAPGANLSGPITAFGLYRDTTFNNSRFDTFTIETAGPPPVPGDTDGDGVVELSDFNPIRDNFRKSVTSRSQGDLVTNGVVDFNDFRQWKVAFLGAGGGALSGLDLGFMNVPEPGTGALLLVAAAAGFVRRRAVVTDPTRK